MLVVPPITDDENIKALIERMKPPKGVFHLSGLWGSSAPLVVATIARSLPTTYLYLTAHPEQADQTRDDLELFSGHPCELFPAWEALPGEGPGAGEIQAERLRIVERLRQRRNEGHRHLDPSTPPLILVAPIQALMQPIPTQDEIDRHTLSLDVGEQVRGLTGQEAYDKEAGPGAVVRWAVDHGFARLDLVESPGDVAQRGDILDLFALGPTHPFRIEFLDDTVESIRRFDPGTQRSIESIASVSVTAIPPQRENASRSATTDLFAYLPEDTVLVLDDPAEVQELGETLLRRLGEPQGLLSPQQILGKASDYGQLHLSRLGGVATTGEPTFDFQVSSVARFEGEAADSVAELARVAEDHDVYVICDNEGERTRLREMLAEHPVKKTSNIRLELGVMHRGFEWVPTKTVVVAHHEVFHRRRQRRRIRKLHAARPLESWTDLAPGDHVVHIAHGIAKFQGLKKIQKGDGGQLEEFLSLAFAGGAIVHVPVSQIDLVQKYIGAGGRHPVLSTLGGRRWSIAKQRAADSVADLAASLLRVQAIRNQSEGLAYPPDTEWQREFEAAFPYEETEDQLLVAGEIRDDLMAKRPMDRLVCGDVGYGKTELAMRAIFKVVEFGRQAAVLVPTTVLAEQHFKTFQDRFADYPFAIGCLSRFRRPAELKNIIQMMKRGQIDIVVGTHRLLSQDVAFANLGLVIIDEEQRFGVEAKEQLKTLRETVDVLTLTATPIPRTLHMSMMGVRDISSLQTPPVDRRSIATQVRSFDQSLIRDAILRELNRDGQVYFVHNLVQSIAAVADTVQSIVPEARVVFGHGQMKDGQLEEVMHGFVERRADVLVATTIIESGIDIPRANTIFINRADRFGLADLHQLRGRVGRSDHRAYCFLLLSPDRTPTSKAAKRLKTIEEFSELGAGFRIAMRDLEIRGAGNLLGKEQSGHIAAVGYEMYCRLLEQAVQRLKNEPDSSPTPVHIDLDVVAHIPPHYVRADRQRIEVYRRIVGCRTPRDLAQLEKDVVDAFGPMPKPFDRLMQLAQIRVHVRPFGVKSISVRGPDVIFAVEGVSRAEPLFANAPGSVRTPDAHTIHLRLPENYFEPDTLIAVLQHMFDRAGEKASSIV